MNLTERALHPSATSTQPQQQQRQQVQQQSRPIAVPVNVLRTGGIDVKTNLYSASPQDSLLPLGSSDLRILEGQKHSYRPWSTVVSASATGIDALEPAESPKTTSSTSNGSEREWRRSLLAESDPIHKESGRSRSRDTQGQRVPLSAGAPPAARAYDIEGGATQQQQQRQQQHSNGLAHALSEQHSNVDSSSPSSISSFPNANSAASVGHSEPRTVADNSGANDAAARFRASSAHRAPLASSPSRSWLEAEGGSPMRGTSGVWSPQNTASTAGGGESHDGGARRSRPTRSASAMADWSVSSRRSLSSTGINNEPDSRPPMVHRALSINTAPLGGHFAGVQQTFSPSSWQSGSPDGIASSVAHHTTSSPMPGLGRLPEGEEAASDAGGFFSSAASIAPFFPSQQQQQQQQGRPVQRHRSTSSAAALQGMAGGGAQDRLYDQHSRSASVWGTGPLSADLAGSPGSLAFFTQQQQQQQQTAAPSPTLNRLMGSDGNERGRSMQQRDVAPMSLHSGNDHVYHGGNTSAMAFSIDEAAATIGGGGSESRRHSMMAAPPTVPGQQRRAIGFEVSRPIPGSRTSSVGRMVGSPPPRTTGFGMFGRGNSALSDDDLATDLDALRINLDEAARQHQLHAHVSAAASIHAASVPARGYASFSTGSPHRAGYANWPISARPGDDEEASSIWGEHGLPSSPPSAHASRTGVQQTSKPSDGRAAQPPGLSARAHSFQQQHAVGSGGKRSSISSAGAVFEPFGSVGGGGGGGGGGNAPSAASKGSLSDHAIASLVTLGPLAPPTGGGGGGPGAHDGGSGGGGAGLQDLGKGVPLQMLPRDTPLYIVEFKQGRTDLYFRQAPPGGAGRDLDEVRKGDLVIVEADRGKDLGSVINDTITVEQVQVFLAQQAELAQLAATGAQPDGVHPAAVTLGRLTRSVNPKRLFAKAGPADTSLLHAKAQDEERALTLCTTKVNQRGLPMAVVAAEMQWDRRKLTFYYTATQRVDFRDLVKELFRLYKTRIWMCHLSHPRNGGAPNAAASGAGQS